MLLDPAHGRGIAREEARRGNAAGHVAVGARVVQGDTVLARGRHLVASPHDPPAHAETVTRRAAGTATQRVDCAGWTLSLPFAPCPLCCGALLASGISTLVMGARPAPGAGRWGSDTVEGRIDFVSRRRTLQVVPGVLGQICAALRQGEGHTREGQGRAQGAQAPGSSRTLWKRLCTVCGT
jgi:tRNA(adenine34) deaminase